MDTRPFDVRHLWINQIHLLSSFAFYSTIENVIISLIINVILQWILINSDTFPYVIIYFHIVLSTVTNYVKYWISSKCVRYNMDPNFPCISVLYHNVCGREVRRLLDCRGVYTPPHIPVGFTGSRPMPLVLGSNLFIMFSSVFWGFSQCMLKLYWMSPNLGKYTKLGTQSCSADYRSSVSSDILMLTCTWCRHGRIPTRSKD